MKQLVLAALLVVTSTFPALAQVSVTQPWVRASVAHQRSTGAFMSVTAANDARLLGVQSPVAKIVELHEMKMEGDVMKMRRVESIALPAGKAVELKPGGYHVMLIDLNGPLEEGDTVPLSLVIQDKDGKRETVAVSAPVRPLNQRHGHTQ